MERASELDPRNFFLALNVAGFYFGSRPLPYEQTRKALDRVLALKPNYIDARIDAGGGLEMHWRADTRHWHATIEKILADEPASANDQAMKLQRFQLALFERDFIAASRAVAALPQEGADGFSRDFWMGVVARAKGDVVAAQAAFTAARAQQEAAVGAARARQPDYAPALSTLGIIDAGLGRKEEALREGRRAVELMPIAKDSTDGPRLVFHLACDLRVDWRTRPGHRATRNSFENPKRSNLRHVASGSGVGFSPRRSALRKNRRLSRAEVRWFRSEDRRGWNPTPDPNAACNCQLDRLDFSQLFRWPGRVFLESPRVDPCPGGIQPTDHCIKSFAMVASWTPTPGLHAGLLSISALDHVDEPQAGARERNVGGGRARCADRCLLRKRAAVKAGLGQPPVPLARATTPIQKSRLKPSPHYLRGTPPLHDWRR